MYIIISPLPCSNYLSCTIPLSSLCEVAPEAFPQRADFGALCSFWSPTASLHCAQALPCSSVS